MMNSISNQSDSSKEISFVKEIQMMMFGLGDSATPLASTASVIEEVVLQQMVMLIGQAEEVAERRGVDGIYPQDILFLMRKDVHKLNRIISYIAFKDVKKAVTSLLNDGEKPGLDDLLTSVEANRESKRKTLCLQFLQSIGVQLDETGTDIVKQERLRRADMRVQTMSQRSYEEYYQSRRSTFLGAKLNTTRFLDWLKQSCTECAPKLRLFSVDLLLYLAKETVAQLIDMALLLRQDANTLPNNPFSRLPQSSLPFETFRPSNRQLEGPPAITPSEIREVLRRFYSVELCPWGAFTTNLDPAVFNKILTCC